MTLKLYFFIPILGIIFAVGYLWYTVMGTQNQRSKIGHEAHFGGAVAGVVLAIILKFKDSFEAHPLQTLLIIAILIGGYYYIDKKNKMYW
jgi:membrane associated rhomboid family serine protease